MTKQERRQEFRRYAGGSVELGRDTIQNMLKWTEWVAEHEYSAEDHSRLLEAFEELYLVVQPINERYIDGGEHK